MATSSYACSPSPSPSAGASGAPATGQFCQGTKIVFFPGGTPGGGFETVVYNGAKAAEAAFGPTVTYQWSDWDPAKMITQFQRGRCDQARRHRRHGPSRATTPSIPLIDDADQQGHHRHRDEHGAPEGTGEVRHGRAPATSAPCCTTPVRPSRNEAIARGGLKSGDRAFVWGLVAQAGRGERTQGILDALEEAGLTVDYLEIDDATNADPAAGVSTFTGYGLGQHRTSRRSSSTTAT